MFTREFHIDINRNPTVNSPFSLSEVGNSGGAPTGDTWILLSTDTFLTLEGPAFEFLG